MNLSPPSPPGRATAGHRARLDRAAALVGSEREARWIVEHAEAEGGQDGATGGAPGVDATVDALATRRAAGEPLQYVLGRWPFRTLELEVDHRALIPRPETEEVAGLAVAAAVAAAAADPPPEEHRPPVRVVDLGTGSGAIALSVAAEAGGPVAAAGRGLEVWATDSSADALALAAANLARTGVDAGGGPVAVHLSRGSWWAALDPGLAGGIDVVVANPPYVGVGELPGLDPVVRDWEPRAALVASAGPSGVDGTADLEALVAGAPAWLRPGGVLILELAPVQATAMVAAARAVGLVDVRVVPDRAGRSRVLVATRR